MLKSRIVNICFSLLFFIVVVNDVFREVSGWFYLATALGYLCFQAYGSFVLSAQFFLPVKYKGKGNAIALTFDDGPIPGKTEKVLEILRSHKATATFFCIGHRVKEHPQIIQRIHNEGHLLGNHSYWHAKTFDLQSTTKIVAELKDTDLAINQSIGMVPKFFRPPYGVTNPMVAEAVRQGNYTTIGWSVRSFDTIIEDSTKLMSRVTSTLKGGDIVLFHDYSESMLEILPAFLDHVSGLGLKIVRLDELLNEKAYV